MFGTYCRLNLPIYASNRAVIRAARLKLQPKFRRDRSKRGLRKSFYRDMLRYHSDAKALAAEFRL